MRVLVHLLAQRSATLSAEEDLQLRSGLVRCGDTFRSARRQFEAAVGNDKADGVSAAGDLLAGQAVTEDLGRRKETLVGRTLALQEHVTVGEREILGEKASQDSPSGEDHRSTRI